MRRIAGWGMLSAMMIGCAADAEPYTTKESGLKFIDVKEGKGDAVKDNDTVKINYTGRLATTKKVFDSTLGKAPVTWDLARTPLIPGFLEGLVGMKAGGKRKVYVPAKLGYGADGHRDIPANSDLIFELEVLSIGEDKLPGPTAGEEKVKVTTLREGTGPAAKEGDVVRVHYRGKLASDGQEFDNSYQRGEPYEVRIGYSQVIVGWHRGLVGIKAGEKRRLEIPSSLGYGPQGRRPIPPNADLVFDLEAVSVDAK